MSGPFGLRIRGQHVYDVTKCYDRVKMSNQGVSHSEAFSSRQVSEGRRVFVLCDTLPRMTDAPSGKRAHENAAKVPRARKRSRFAPVDVSAATEKKSLKRPRDTGRIQENALGRDSRFAGLSSRSSESKPLSHDVTSIPIAPVSTIRINRNAAMEKRIKGTLKVTEKDLIDEDPNTNPYFDPSITIKTEVRRPAKPSFKFVEQGKIAARAEKLRDRAEEEAITEAYREKIAARAAENSAVPELPPYIENRQPYADGKKTPNVEWWDAPFLSGDSYLARSFDKQDSDSQTVPAKEIAESGIALEESKITVFVHHPKKIASSLPEKPPVVLPLMLTQKERKRLRRQRRQEKIREEQELIAVGLRPLRRQK